MKKIVITGAPHAGKSTLLNKLQQAGYVCVEEAGMQVFDGLNKKLGVDGQIQWREKNGAKLQSMIIDQQSENEKKAEALAVDCIFLDRGQHDSLSYIELNNREVPALFMEKLNTSNYHQVFLLDIITPFDVREDTGRNLCHESAKIESEKLNEVYQRFGYEVIRVPQLEISERVNYILSRAAIN